MAAKAPVAVATFALCILASKFEILCKSRFQQDLLIKQELAKAYLALVKAKPSVMLAWIRASCCITATLPLARRDSSVVSVC